MSHEDRTALGRRYAGPYEEVGAILFRLDPVGIAFVATDEYDKEVSTILPRAVRATSQAEVEEIVREEFERWFAGVAMREETFEPIATEVYEAVLNYRSA